jgi:hypothetical protein
MRVFQDMGPASTVELRPGHALLIHPFGTRQEGDEPVTIIRVEGPFAVPPRAGVAWHRPDTVREGSYQSANIAAAVQRGVKLAVSNRGAMDVSAVVEIDSIRLRITLEGHPPSAATLVTLRGPTRIGGTRVMVPGLPDSLQIGLRPTVEEGQAACFYLMPEQRDRELRRRGLPGASAVNGRGCFSAAHPENPVRIFTTGMPALTVEMVP